MRLFIKYSVEDFFDNDEFRASAYEISDSILLVSCKKKYVYTGSFTFEGLLSSVVNCTLYGNSLT